MSNQIIQQLIQDGSDDKNPTLQENAEAEPEEPNIIKEEDEIDIEEECKEEIVVQDEMNESTCESLDTISDPIVQECHPDIELKEEEDKNIPLEEEATELANQIECAVIDHKEYESDTEKEGDDLTEDDMEIKEEIEIQEETSKPIIANRRKTLDYSPSFMPTVKLLGKRQSIDPVRIKSSGVSNVPDITKKTADYVPSEVKIPAIGGAMCIREKGIRPPSKKEMAKAILPPDQPRPFVTTPNPGRNRALMEAPNLIKLMSSSDKSPGKRPDSAQSNSTTTTTTSCSLSLSEADSGVSDLSHGSRRSSGMNYFYFVQK